MTKVRILRRGRGPLCSGGDHKPILEVEVIGKMTVSDEIMPNDKFEVYADDGQHNLYKADIVEANADGSWDLQVEGGRGIIEGFKGNWEMTPWDEDFYEKHGLRAMDNYNCARQGWPPAHWSSGSSSDEEEVQAAVHGEGNGPANGNDGNCGDGNDDDGGEYIPSDAESAA